MVITPLQNLEEDLKKVEDKIRETIDSRGGTLKPSADLIFKSGGKRLRPALVILTSRLFEKNERAVVAVAAAVEMIHGASLLHDDVLDGTIVRRGKPTLNSTHGDHHSVLMGDFLLCQALLTIAELGQVELLQVISQAVADMTEGQIREAELQGKIDTATEAYMEVVDGKTAALMAAGCRLAALGCGAPPAQVEAVTIFGRKLGLSFQIVDDVLDFWGDPEFLGKPIGSDLKEKKYTLPFLDSYGRSVPEEQQWVQKIVANGGLDNGGMKKIVRWMEEHQAQERALEIAARHTREAGKALQALPPSRAKEALLDLLAFVTERRR